MLLTPRYDGPPVLRGEVPGDDPAVPLLRQRRRLAHVFAGLDGEQWAAPTRCARWSVQDVVAHLAGVNEAWATSFTGARAGAPTTIFHAFDPVTSPPRRVDAARRWSRAEALDRYVATTDALATSLDGVDARGLALTAESPLGHVALALVVHHALWDAWIHERDVLLPLGLVPAEEPDEVAACLAYVAALGPALLATGGSTRRATLCVEATGPGGGRVVVEVGPDVVVRSGPRARGAVLLAGHAVDLVEGLSLRVPLTVHVAAGDRWLLGGLAAAFDDAGGATSAGRAG